jgi:hypothetical protein
MTLPLILREWPDAPPVPAGVEGFLDLRVRDLIAIMQAEDATHYTMVDGQAEVTVAVCVGYQFGQLAAAAQQLFTPRPPARGGDRR